jgi:PAS domain S-box-containing protein
MTPDADQQALRADVLARLLLVQSTAGHLPDETVIISFVCRGLEMVPGVAKVSPGERESRDAQQPSNIQRLPIQFAGTDHGDVLLQVDDPLTFAPYAPHVQNMLFMVGVILEERRQRRLTEAYQRDLEMRVEQRTRQLTDEINERRNAEARALAEARRAERYLEISEAIIVNLDNTGKILLINKRGGELLGYSPPDLVGQSWFDVAIAPQHREAVRRSFEQLIAGNAKLAEYHEEAIVTRTGELLHIAWHNVLHIEEGRIVGTLSSGTDVTGLKRAAEALAAEKEHLAVTLRSIGDGVITTDTNGRVTVMNPVAEQLTGWVQDEARGQLLSEVFVIIDERTQAPCVNPVNQVLTTQAVVELSNHTRLIARDGTGRAIMDSGAPIRDRSGNIVGVILVFRDVTDKQRLIEQMQRAERLDAIGLLAGGVAHDFNNLLGGIFGYISMARDLATGNVPQIEALDDALRVFERARALTQQLLTFSKGGEPVRTVVNLRNLLADCTRFTLSGSNVSYQLQLPLDLPDVEVDANQIWQVIDNLVRNANQAMPLGGNIIVSSEVVALRAHEHPSLAAGQYIKVTVADNGPGIPPDFLPRIFDPFFTTKERGSGLGLAMAYSVIRKHDGHIEAESQLGRGSSFRFFLPASHHISKPAPAVGVDVKHVGKGRALVMDDEPYLRKLLTKCLTQMGYEVTTVSDGQAAVAACERSVAEGQRYVVAILDLTVPGGMGGKEAIARIRVECPDLVAIASSGYSEDPIMSRPQEYGFSASLPKPFSSAELAAVLESVKTW